MNEQHVILDRPSPKGALCLYCSKPIDLEAFIEDSDAPGAFFCPGCHPRWKHDQPPLSGAMHAVLERMDAIERAIVKLSGTGRK